MTRQRRRKLERKKFKVTCLNAPNFDIWVNSTNSSLDKCYANQFGNCGGGISREHYISKSLLDKFDGINSKGIPWLSHLDQNFTSDDLVAKCLCKYHNTYLSPLDELAGPVFDSLVNFGKNREERVYIDGRHFELWMLKMLIGLICTNKFEHNGNKFGRKDIPKEWVKWLFIDRMVPEKLGIFFMAQINHKLEFGKKFGIGPIYSNNSIVGINVELAGIKFLMSLKPKEEAFKKDHPLYEDIIYRMQAFNKERSDQGLVFQWPHIKLLESENIYLSLYKK